jgi:peptidoglycan hydrolase CwlO-like protein
MNKKTFWAIATVISAVSYAAVTKNELKEKNDKISELKIANTDLTNEINDLKLFSKE